MDSNVRFRRSGEILVQILLYGLVFTFFAAGRRHPEITLEEVIYFANFALLAIVISYVLIPKFLYPKKYLAFGLGIIIALAGTMLIEELLLERVFYPDTRFQRFPGVFYTLLGILPITSILVSFKLGWDAISNRNQLDNLQTVMKDNELQYLRSQINPHFLFNNLNNLYSHALENSPKTPDIILELSSVLRYMLYDCKTPSVLVSKEIKNLSDFIKIGELQIENRGTVDFKHEIEQDYSIAPMIMIVFVENAFKHSSASLSDGIEIDIQIHLNKEGILNFSCRNNYLPDDNGVQTDGGIGLDNVVKHLDLVYPDAYLLQITDQRNIYDVHLKIDLTKAHTP